MSTVIKTDGISSLLKTAEVKVLGDMVFEVSLENSKMIIEVKKYDLAEKTMVIRHNHTTHQLTFKNELDLVLDKMGIKRSSENIQKNIKAPMPGKVIDIIAKEGDKLQKGDNILILEAMKMENVIKAEAECVVKKVLISKQTTVEKNQIMVELDFA